MSSTIVRSMNTVKNADGKWVIKANTAESNIYPRWFHEWTGSTGYDSREELDGGIIRDFHTGCFRGGSRYNAFVRECEEGVYTCKAWDSYKTMCRLHNKVFQKCLDVLNLPKDNPERIRWHKVAQRIDRWIHDTYKPLGIAFREWKPSKDKFIIKVDGCLVVSAGKRSFRYLLGLGGDNTSKAKKFTKVAALDFCERFKNHNPVMMAVA